MNYPQAIFAPVPSGSHIKGSIDCLITAEANGDIVDRNKAAGDIVDELQRRFYAIVEMTDDLPQFEDMTYTERDDFVYYATMETLGHGVGLSDDPDRFPEDAIELARKETALSKALSKAVDWMETHVNTDWNDQTLTVQATVEVITKESAANSEAAGRFTIPATASEIGDWQTWIDGYDLDEPFVEDYDPPTPEEYTPLEFVQMLDACDLTFEEGSCWTDVAGLQGLLAIFGYRRLPTVRINDEDVEVISASITVRVTKVVDPQGDDNLATPEGLEAGRDSYYDRYKAAEAEIETAATAAKEEDE